MPTLSSTRDETKPSAQMNLLDRVAPLPQRFMVENSFFEHLGLIGGFLLVAWLDLRKSHRASIGDSYAQPQLH